jgi:hypothetical protein
MSDRTTPEIVNDLITLISPKLPLLAPHHARAAFQFLAALTDSAPPNSDSGRSSESDSRLSDRPDPVYCQKGRKFWSKWHLRVMTALAEKPLTRDEISAAIKDVYGTCIPPFSVAQLLHLMWSRGLVERFPQEAENGRTYPTWRLTEVSMAARKDTTCPPETPKQRRLKNPTTREEAAEWLVALLDEAPEKRMEIATVKAAAAEADVDPDLLKSMGHMYGRPRIGYFYDIACRWSPNKVDYLLLAQTEDKQPIVRNDAGVIVASP